MKTCRGCKQEKEDEAFSWKNKKTGTRNSLCRPCRNDYVRGHYERNKEQYLVRIRKYDKKRKVEISAQFLDYLSSKSCEVCGEADIRVLDFDHKDRKEKKGCICTMVSMGCSWATIMQEIEKCSILCANCHRKRTNTQFNFYRQRFIANSELQDVRRGISEGS